MNIQYSTEDFCSICYEPYNNSTDHDAFKLQCQHAFGRSCIKTWATKNITCPMCGLSTFPPELLGGLNPYRRLADRTILAPDPIEFRMLFDREEVGLGCAFLFGFSLGFSLGSIEASIIGTNSDTVAVSVTIASLLSVSIGVFRGMALGNEGALTCSYFLGCAAGLAISTFVI